MQEIISEFFHRLGVAFSIFTFIALWLVMAESAACDSISDILVPFLGCIFIYCIARFTGWVVNCLISGR